MVSLLISDELPPLGWRGCRVLVSPCSNTGNVITCFSSVNLYGFHLPVFLHHRKTNSEMRIAPRRNKNSEGYEHSDRRLQLVAHTNIKTSLRSASKKKGKIISFRWRSLTWKTKTGTSQGPRVPGNVFLPPSSWLGAPNITTGPAAAQNGELSQSHPLLTCPAGEVHWITRRGSRVWLGGKIALLKVTRRDSVNHRSHPRPRRRQLNNAHKWQHSCEAGDRCARSTCFC
jgi:hypothetical protein